MRTRASLDEAFADQYYDLPGMILASRGNRGNGGVYAMTEYEIGENGFCCFAEVSGAIERIYAERDVCIVPNTDVKKILGSKGVEPVEGDAFRYKHTYPDGTVFEKVLYGFKG